MGHGPDQAAHTHHTEEGEEGLLAPRTGAFPWHHSGILRGDGGEACTACEVLEGKVQPFYTGGISGFPTQGNPSAKLVTA